MAESVVAFLLNQLSDLLYMETTYLGGLRREIQYVKDELGSMRAFLKDIEAKEDRDFELQEWIKQVREVAYDTEDVLDEFAFLFATHHADGFCGRFQKIYTSMKNLRASHRISTRIKDIKYRVESISSRHQRYQSVYGVSERGSASLAGNLRYDVLGHALLLEEANLVGIHQPKSELISHVLDKDSHLKVISVVGMGGLGKTTLVKRVYEDGDVKRRFPTRAWVTISHNFDPKDLLNSMILQLFKENHEPVPPEEEEELADVDGLKALIKGFLREKRYLIVLDDVWSIESWDAIKYILPDGGGSRVMLTTRIADIASFSCKECRGYVHKMKPLSAEESWTLFCSKTFEDNQCPSHLEEVSRNILSKCEGLPLAIVAIRGLLALKNKRKLVEWEMVLHSLGGELEGTGKLDLVKRMLCLSYNDLPFYLRSCLLYASIYLKDYQIFAWELIRLWVAEGFVQEKEGATSIEVTESYLEELVNRSLIQVVETKVDGTIEFCRIHDLLREILLSKSRECNISTIVNWGCAN